MLFEILEALPEVQHNIVQTFSRARNIFKSEIWS